MGAERIVVALAVLLAVPAGARDEEPVSADRPGVATSAAVVPTGTVQAEMGIQYTQQTARSLPRVTALSLPNLLLRWAPWSRIELRLSGEGYVYRRASPGPDGGSGGDVGIATKVRVTEQDGPVPDFSLLAQLDFPIDSPITTNAVSPSGLLLADWALADDWELEANLGFAAPGVRVGEASRVFQVQPILSLGWSATERLGTFIEWYGSLRDGEPNQQSADGGFTYLVTNDVQLDVSAGLGLNDAAPDWFVGGGLVWRWWIP